MKSKLGQKGIASIVITTTISIVVTLIIVGFAAIARREQRQALDAQLSSQAFYAAEAKLNQITAQLSADPDLVLDECLNDTSDSPRAFTGDSGQSVISCAKVITPPDIVTETAADQVAVQEIPNGDTKYIDLSWTHDSASQCRTGYELPTSYSTSTLGMIRLEITRLQSAGNAYGRDTLTNNTYSMLLHPNSSTPAPTYTPDTGLSTTWYFGNTNIGGNIYGYTSSEYNKWRTALEGGATGATRPTTNADGSGLSWKPFWNWHGHYKQFREANPSFGLPEIPAQYVNTISRGNYERRSGTDDIRYFKTWATRVINGNELTQYPYRNPARKLIGSPGSPNTTFDTNPLTANPIIIGRCVVAGGKATGSVRVEIPDALVGASTTGYAIRLRSIYNPTKLTITPYDASGRCIFDDGTCAEDAVLGGTPPPNTNKQKLIEVTARIGDIVRRIQARTSTGENGGTVRLPDYGIRTTGSLCKLVAATPDEVTDGCVAGP